MGASQYVFRPPGGGCKIFIKIGPGGSGGLKNWSGGVGGLVLEPGGLKKSGPGIKFKENSKKIDKSGIKLI